MRVIRKVKKVIAYLSLALIILLLAGIGFSIIYQDKIVNLFISEVNHHLKTPIQVEKIRFSVVEKFPQMAIILEDVYINESLPKSKEPMAVANNIYLTFSLLNLLKGKYVINEIQLEDAEVYLKITKKGKFNYQIFHKRASGSNQDISFDIEHIKLKRVQFQYYNERKNQLIDLYTDDLKSTLSQRAELMNFIVKGAIKSNDIKIGKDSYFKEKDLSVDALFNYNVNDQLLAFEPSAINIKKAQFKVEGTYLIDKTDEINLLFEAENTDIQTIFSLLPANVYDRFRKYKSKGDIYFNGLLKGSLGRDISPKVSISFGCKNATFIYPNYKKELKKVNLTGSFESPSITSPEKAKLTLENINAELDRHPIKGALTIYDFKKYQMDCSIKGTVDVKSVLGFFPVKQIQSASGKLDIDVDFKGKYDDMTNRSGISKVKNSGDISVQDLSFKLKDNKLPFRDLNGQFLFHNNDLAINDFKAKVGNSDFNFNGYFKNFLSQVFSKKHPLIIETDLKSSLIDLDELLSSSTAVNSSNTSVKYSFDITPRLRLQFNCDIKKLKFRRFRGKNIKGDLRVNNQIAMAKNLNFEAAGGRIKLDGAVDARSRQNLAVRTNASFNGLNIDSVFYIFENFNQSFLEDRHLKGQVYSEVSTSMVFTKALQLRPSTLVADVETSIRNGELNNFEPMRKVAKYVRRESLDHLRFSEVKNYIHIENQIIYLPPTEVSSNVRTIQVQGTHTFQQLIKYNLKIPIRNPDKRDKDEAFGAIEESSSGNTNLFLTIIGSTSDYQVAYNTEAVKGKIKDDIKKEGKELKDLFKNKGRKKQTIELDEEEFFEFDSLSNVNDN